MCHLIKKNLLGVAVTVALTQGAVGQEIERTTVLEEVLVTAQKRAQSLQDVPISVNAFDGDALERARISDVRSIAAYTPGLSMDAFPSSQPRPYIRGIGSSDKGAGGDQSAAAFTDGVYLSRPGFLSFDSFDLERIEVLKGPQGTLWGKNVVGGAIHFITNKPQEEFDARVSLTSGNEGTLNGSGMINVPLVENTVLLRAVVNKSSHDGYADNVYLNKEQDDQDRLSGRVHLQIFPNENSDLLLTLYGSKDDNNGPARHQYSPSITGLSLDPDGSARKTTASNNGFDKKNIFGANATLNWELGIGNFTSILAYRNLDYSKSEDIDGNNLGDQVSGGVAAIQQLDLVEEEETDVWSIEARLAAPEESEIFWQVGFFYENDEIERVQEGTLFFPAVGRDVVETIITPNETDSIAVFGEVTYPLGENANITGGLRWSRDEKSFGATATQEGPGRVFVREVYDRLETTDSWEEVTWRITGDMHFTDNVFGYATVSTGFKSGGFQDTPPNPTAAVTPFEPEKVINYELGLKMDWSRVRTNVSVFMMDLEDQQVRSTNQDGATITANAGESEIKGFELELTVMPTDSLSLAANYTYLDATFTEYVDEGDDFSGNTISKSPENAYTLTANYSLEDFSGTGGALDLGVDYLWTDKVYGDNSNLQPEIVDGYGLLNARAVYAAGSGQWDVSIWGKNLTDEEYPVHLPNFGVGTWYIFGPPRTFGVTFNWYMQ